jgi:uncharacterized membrane protein HdeD (DUF308 family)
LFAIYAFMDAGFQAVRGFSSGKAGSAVGHLLLGLIDVGAGVVALAWPAPTALVLVLVVAFWAIFRGFSEVFAFGAGETAGLRAMYLITGVVWIAFGVVLFGRPGLGAVTLAILFGLFSLVSGTTMITRGVDMHRAGRAPDPGKRGLESRAV